MTNKADITEEPFRVDSTLRTVLLGIGRIVQGELDVSECERVFHDFQHDRVARKRYSFHQSSSWVVTGLVEENKPDWIRLKIVWLRKEAPVAFGDTLADMAHAARMATDA